MNFEISKVKSRVRKELKNINNDADDRKAIAKKYRERIVDMSKELAQYKKESIVHPDLY